MQLINGQILLIELYIILKVSSQNTRNILRILTEITNNPNKTIAKYCSGFSDCFNCTVIPKCRWVWEKESCIPFEPFIEQYSIPLLNENSENNDLTKLNEHINFIRQCCFNPLNPYIDNSNSYKYSNSVVKYCGPHYLIYNNENINNFKIEIKKVNEIYGIPNLLCEFIILSGPNFYVNIKIDEEQKNNFYLLYSKDSLNFNSIINSTTIMDIKTDNNYLNTFIFYGLKSFEKSPFVIEYRESIMEKAKEVLGYIMIALSCIMVIIIVIAIILIRKKAKFFLKREKNPQIDENEKLKQYNKKQNGQKNLLEKLGSEEIKLEDKKSNGGNYHFNGKNKSSIQNGQELPYDNICCLDLKIIENKEDIKIANCGHYYHILCYNNLIKEMENSNKKEIKCISCKKIIYTKN